MKTLHIFSNLQSLLHLIPVEYSGVRIAVIS